VIPTAKVFEYKGAKLVAVPHRLDETRVLRNLGFGVPAPVELYYDWPGQFSPFKAQLATTSFLTTNPHAFVLSDMGTGKTLAALWAFDWLRSVGKAKKMLVVSPLSTLERTWADEIFANFPGMTVGVLHGTKDRRKKVLAADHDIYLVNHDGIKVIEADLVARDDIDTVIVDEIAAFRNAGTSRWKSLNRILAGRTWIWGMTGTPTPNAPTDAWAQCRLISPDRVPRYFGAFRDSVMKQLGPFKWLPRECATRLVAEAMQPAVRFTRDECVDLPPCIYLTREVPLTTEQNKAYKEMAAKLKMEFAADQVTAINEAVKMGKLVQIACGVVYGADKKEVVLPTEPRVKVVKEIIEEAGTKVIVFVPYKAVLRYVADELGKEFSVAQISGDTPKHERDDIFHHFQKSAEPRVLVAQPAAMSHGLTLTAASTVIWYAPVTSHEIYQQANARITRPGQKHKQLIVNVEATEVERRIYSRLRQKTSIQGLLLDLVKSE
jgi:SNF2 family DNA or RNA helicase